MNIPRSTLRRRRFLQSSSVLALGAASSFLAGRKLFQAPRPTPTAHRDEPIFREEPTPSIAPPAAEHTQVVQGAAEEHFDLPPAPLRPLENEDLYADFLASLDLRHLSPREIIDPHRGTTNGVENSLPPEAKWEKLIPTLRAADEIRERLGVPLCRITSGYRCPRYNAAIPGAVRGSYHTKNQALDLVYFCSPHEAYRTAVQLRNEGYFRGGVGLYSTFIHLDTRGYAATWRRA